MGETFAYKDTSKILKHSSFGEAFLVIVKLFIKISEGLNILSTEINFIKI